MRKRIIIINSIIVSISLIIMMIISVIVVSNENYNNASRQTMDYLALATSFYDGTNEEELIKEFKNANSHLRVTVINQEGNVIADSDIKLIEASHIDRLEINNLGTVYKRYSETLGRDMLYVAALDDGNYIRIAFPIESINSITTTFVTVGCIALAIIITLSIMGFLFIFKKSLEPINNEIKNLSDMAERNNFVDGTIDDLPKIIEAIRYSIDGKLKKIKQQNEQINDVLNTLNSGILVLDNEGNILLINKSSLRIFKMTYENVINKSYVYLIRDKTIQDLINTSIDKRINNESLLQIDDKYYNVVIQHQESSWISNGLIIVIRDVTQAISLDKTKREFFANASHELKSPLTCIIGYQQLITEGIETDMNAILDYSKLTLSEAKRMNDIVVDMLDLAKLERQDNLKNETVYCKNIILDIIHSLKQRIDLKNITVTTNIEDVILEADIKQIDQLFRNLIDNAIKYSNDNGNIIITLTNESFIIEDDGIGIPLEDQKHVFERFYRVDKAKSKSLGGTGLGLAIVKHICENHGFNILLKSAVSVGTTIEIRFKN